MVIANPAGERRYDDRKRPPSPGDPRVQKIRENLRCNPKLNAAALAKSVCMSRSRLDALFKSEVGVSLGDYIRESCLKLARKWLESRDLSVKEIAYKIGYEHPSSFIRSFKSKFGMTPAAYRRSLAKEK